MRTKYTHETALATFADTGLLIKARSNPSYWSAEDHSRAKTAEAMLPAMRAAYAALRDNSPDVVEKLRVACNVVGGIEGNFIRLVALDLYGVDFYK